MEIHEAIKKARKELGLTQQKLANLAGIERKQLSIMEGGGNVTLLTVRKVLAHLPNMQPFTLGGITATAAPPPSLEAQVRIVEAAAKALATALQGMVDAVGTLNEHPPSAGDVEAVREAGRLLFEKLGYTAEDYDRELAAQEPLTEENADAVLEAMKQRAKQRGADLAELRKELEGGGSGDDKAAG